MIAKVVQNDEGPAAGSYSHEMLVEAERIELRFQNAHPNLDSFDWLYTDQQIVPDDAFVCVIRSWSRWPSESYEDGIVVSGRIFLINSQGKTIDRKTVFQPA